MPDLQGKYALVTGAGSGIGVAMSLRLGGDGAAVMCADIDEDAARHTAARIAEAGGRAEAIRLDVTDEASVREVVARTIEALGGLNILMNNAGIAGGDWARTIEVNLTGVYYGLAHGAQAMAQRGGGAIVNTASGVGLVGYPNQAAYTASKHGVLGLTKVAALDYGSKGVRVNAICPGTARTPMVDEAIRQDPAIDDYLKTLHPIGRIGEAEEIAEAAVWLCSPAASFVLGVALPVDGGYVIP